MKVTPKPAQVTVPSPELLESWVSAANKVHALGRTKSAPLSRRFTKVARFSHGWRVVFDQTVIWPDGQRARVSFWGTGSSRRTAIANSLRWWTERDLAFCHPRVAALGERVRTSYHTVDSAHPTE